MRTGPVFVWRSWYTREVVRTGVLTVVILATLGGGARAEGEAQHDVVPEAVSLRPLVGPLQMTMWWRYDRDFEGGVEGLEGRFNGGGWPVEPIVFVDDSSFDVGVAVALGDQREARALAFEAHTGFSDVPFYGGFHLRQRVDQVLVRIVPSQVQVLRGDSDTEVTGRLPVAFGLQAAPRVYLEGQVELFRWSRRLGRRYFLADQLLVRTAAWFTLPVFERTRTDAGVAVDIDPVNNPGDTFRLWFAVRSSFQWR